MSIVRWLLQKPGTTELAPFRELLPQVGGYEQRLRGLTDGELTAAAQAAREDAEICACGREAARRALGERPYDVQMLGTLAMLSGLVAEMGTGEGKTLCGALAAAGHALRGRSVHVMSVNDYLARRDAEWMRPVYDLLGVTVGWIGQASTVAERRRGLLAELSPGVDRSVLVSAARQIVLFHLDRAWTEHLAFLADLREGIHLRALARGTVPLNEFNREAIRAFRPLLEEAAARSAQTFRIAAITPGGVDLEAIGLKRPTATWTYLVHEDPFGTDIDRALRSIARRVRKLAVH
jgi:preprotein translocase subunit SecA